MMVGAGAIMINNKIDEAFITADKITAEANYDDAKWNLHVEGLNPAEMSAITQWLEHIRPGFIKENHLVYVLGSFGSNSHRKV